MQRHLLVAVAAVCLVNGLFSPFTGLVHALWPLWLPALVSTSPQLILFGAIVISALSTLLASGVPAALYERVAGRGGTVMPWVWLVAAILISLPGLGRVAALV